MNLMFSWQEQYLTRSLRSLVRYCSCHSNIKFISSRYRVIYPIHTEIFAPKSNEINFIPVRDCWLLIGRTIFFTSVKNRPHRDKIYFNAFWRENLSMYRIKRNMKMRTITCFGDRTSGAFLITASVSRTKITRSQGPITLWMWMFSTVLHLLVYSLTVAFCTIS